MRVAVLIGLALALTVVLGCGEGASSPRGLKAAYSNSVTTLPVLTVSVEGALSESSSGESGEPGAQATDEQSLHERVMAEQAQARATRPSRSTPTTSSGPHDTTTTTAVPPVQSDNTTTVVLSDGQTPLVGLWGGSAEQLASYLLRSQPSPRFTVPVPVLAEYYVTYCAEARLRADLLWAQMIKETGYGMYGGDVAPEQNNYAGIGATGGHEPGAWFPTAEAGVVAHVAHMVAYVYTSSPVSWADANADPRFDAVYPRGVAYVLADLNGRWAVPGTSYGESIEATARLINAE